MTPPRLLVPALCLSLLLSWGSLYYAFAMLLPPLLVDRHWSAGSAMGAYSVALVVWGLCAYPAGRFIARYGGRCAMALGSCLCGVLFVALSSVQSLLGFYLIWVGLGVGMALTLYEPAFAVLVEAWPAAYRRRMGVLTLAGGLASTAFWPLTHVLVVDIGWRATVLVYGAIHLFICAPMHWLALPASKPASHRTGVEGAPVTAAARTVTGLAMRSRSFWLLAISFACFGFVTAAMATHVIPMLEAKGVDPVAALAMAALIGPMQVAGRSSDLLLVGRLRPRAIGALTVALIPLALAALWVAPGASGLLYVFAVMYGAGLGLLTIVRATAPAEIFGTAGYAAINGALSGPSVLARAAGPLAGTFLMALHNAYDTVLLVLLVFALVGAAAFLLGNRKLAS